MPKLGISFSKLAKRTGRLRPFGALLGFGLLTGCEVTPDFGQPGASSATVGLVPDDPYAANCTAPFQIGDEFRDPYGRFGMCVNVDYNAPSYPYPRGYVMGLPNVYIVQPYPGFGGYWTAFNGTVGGPFFRGQSGRFRGGVLVEGGFTGGTRGRGWSLFPEHRPR